MLKKIDDGAYLMKCMVGVCAGALVLCLFIPDPEIKQWLMWYVTGWFFVASLALGLPMYHRNVRLQWEEGKRVIESIQMKLLSVDTVNQRLQQLADEFTALCQRQVQFQNTEPAAAEAKAIEEEIARVKTRFWEAHALANELGYVMKDRISDYVSVPKVPLRSRRAV